MTELTTLTDKLIAVVVPAKYTKYRIRWDGEEQTTKLSMSGKWNRFQIKLEGKPKDYEIIGAIFSNGFFAFDCAEYAEQHPHSEEYWNYAMMPLYLIHGEKQFIGKHTKFKNGTENYERSFLSLLKSKGVLLDKLYNNQKILILQR